MELSWRVAGTALLRLGPALVYAWGGWAKLDLDARLILHSATYDVWPWLGGRLSWTLSSILPWMELAVAAGLLLPWVWRPAALAGAALASLFLAWIASAAASGFTGDCGCFGDGGSRPDFVVMGLRAAALLVALLAAWWLGRVAPTPAVERQAPLP